MKKVILLFLSVILLLLLLAPVTLGSNGVHEGPGYSQTTDKCAACHRAHTGQMTRLLFTSAASMYQFCTTCHNGTGANTNVVSGIFEGSYTTWGTQGDGEAGMGLNGGGYQSAYAYTGRLSRNAGYTAITGDDMRHNATGTDSAVYTAWGGGEIGPGTQTTLTCASCHDPHGTDNTNGTERYRILRNTVNGIAVPNYVRSNEIAAFGRHEYTRDAYRSGLSAFCVACHTQYKTPMGTVLGGITGEYDAGDGSGAQIRYRHKVDILVSDGNARTGNKRPMVDVLNDAIKLPVEQVTYNPNITNFDVMNCLTCHLAHGSVATMTARSKVGPANSNTLLRLNNRGICEDCHIK